MTAPDSLALQGRHILITRAREHFPAAKRAVEARGGIAFSLPCLEIEPLREPVADALRALDDYSDLLFTSVNGINVVVSVLQAQGLDPAAALRGKRIAVVGEKCAAALMRIGIDVGIVPATASQEGLIDAYHACGLPETLLFFRAEAGRDALITALTRHGVKVRMVAAYRTVCPSDACDDVVDMVAHDQIDAVLLASARTAAHYLQRIGSKALANRPLLVGISERMAAQSRALGVEVQAVAKSASFEAMLDALADYYNVGVHR